MTLKNDPRLPALLGGAPIRPEGPPAWPVSDRDVELALQAAYADGSWGKYEGRYVPDLEDRLAAYHDLPHVLTVGSGTFAVETALRALRIGPGDEVLLAAYDYPGNLLCIHAVGATPALVEVDTANWNLDLERLEAAVGPASRAVIASHLHGGLVPMREVMEIAARHRLVVIEDAAQCPGALIQGRKAGTWGDIGILSFGGSKLLTAGRGGALLTRQAALHRRADLARHRGNLMCPLSELQAAVLPAQLDKLDERNALRLRNVGVLIEKLRDIPGVTPFRNPSGDHQPGYYKVGFQYDAEKFGLARDRLVAALRAEGMAFGEGFRATHLGLLPGRFRKTGDLIEAERAHAGTLILHHPVLLENEASLQQILQAFQKLYDHNALLNEP
jgi:dTDP-4-amino-4,6-dideoxygalactose transaminase